MHYEPLEGKAVGMFAAALLRAGMCVCVSLFLLPGAGYKLLLCNSQVWGQGHDSPGSSPHPLVPAIKVPPKQFLHRPPVFFGSILAAFSSPRGFKRAPTSKKNTFASPSRFDILYFSASFLSRF